MHVGQAEVTAGEAVRQPRVVQTQKLEDRGVALSRSAKSRAQLYLFVGGFMAAPVFGSCHPNCVSQSLITLGDSSAITVIGNGRRRCGSDSTGLPNRPRQPNR